MAESRLERWSRKKTEAGKKVAPPPPPSVEPESSPEEQELAVNEALPEHEVLEKYGLPDPDAIELGTDITGFMRKEIPEMLRRKALRSLWKSNPVLAVLDGLNDYDEDFTDAATATGAVKTLYKVGQGLIDRTEKAAEQVDGNLGEAAAEQPGAPVTMTPPETTEAIEKSEPETEEEAGPHYRPRMRFDGS